MNRAYRYNSNNVSNKISTWGRKRLILVLTVLFCTLYNINFAQAKHLLVFGDSLSAAYGMELEQGWVTLVANELGENHRVSNASISGETSIGGLARLPETLKELNPDLVMLELGANDGLRGLSIQSIKSNLASMIKLIQASGAQVILVGISVPASYGPRYIDQFRDVYQELVKEYKLGFIDFYNETLLSQANMIQADGLHPTIEAQPLIKESVMLFFKTQQLFD